MRLINTTTLELEEFFSSIPKYTILSHTWGNEEVTFQEFNTNLDELKVSQKDGFEKILGCVRQTLRDGFNYCWVDTCCIDKTSSAELSEAINSMFQWYKDSQRCYIFLSDVSEEQPDLYLQLRESRWFTRGWTLQELIAPSRRGIFDANWKLVGELNAKRPDGPFYPIFQKPEYSSFKGTDLWEMVCTITEIPSSALRKSEDLEECCIAEKMSWAATRTTSREEDMAYCLLGLFEINMPLLYGEGGEKAFFRLQEEIIKQSVDRTIFIWQDSPATQNTFQGMLARSPAAFRNRGECITEGNYVVPAGYRQIQGFAEYNSSVAMTNRGLSIQLLLSKLEGPEDEYLACMGCGYSEYHYAILLSWLGEGNQYMRTRPDAVVLIKCEKKNHAINRLTQVFVQQKVAVPKYYQSHRVNTIVFDIGEACIEVLNVHPFELWNPTTRSLKVAMRQSQNLVHIVEEHSIELLIKSHSAMLEEWGPFRLTITLGRDVPQGCKFELSSDDNVEIKDRGMRLAKEDIVLEMKRVARIYKNRLIQFIDFSCFEEVD